MAMVWSVCSPLRSMSLPFAVIEQLQDWLAFATSAPLVEVHPNYQGLGVG